MTIGTRTRFDNQINLLRIDVLKVLDDVKKQHQEALLAIENHDYQISKQIITNDKEIRNIVEDITSVAIWRIASQQPFATDLRMIIGYMNILRDLERISNYAKNISKFNVKYQPETNLVKELKNLMTINFEMLDLIAKAIEEEDIKSAYQAAEKDKVIDDLFKESIDKITEKIKNPKNAKLIDEYTAGIQQLKYMERLGDHLVNICETIVYIAKGKFYDLSVPKEDQ